MPTWFAIHSILRRAAMVLGGTFPTKGIAAAIASSTAPLLKRDSNANSYASDGVSIDRHHACGSWRMASSGSLGASSPELTGRATLISTGIELLFALLPLENCAMATPKLLSVAFTPASSLSKHITTCRAGLPSCGSACAIAASC